jgi:hypothetical protein
MLTNGADELRSSVGKARGSLARGRISPGVEAEALEGNLLKVVP